MTNVVNTVPRGGTGGDLGLDSRYIEGQLRQGRVVQIEWRGGGGDHEFNIVPQGDGTARVLHANVGVHRPRYEDPRSINDIMVDLRTSTTTTGRGCIDATQRLVRMEIIGNSPMKVRGVVTGTPDRTLLNPAGNPNSYFNAARDRFLAAMEQQEREYLANVRALKMQLGKGTAVGVVISLGLAIVSECRDNTKGRTAGDIVENIGVKTVIGGAGGFTGVVTSRLAEAPLVRLHCFVPVVLSVSCIEQRKRMASNLAGSAGGLIGGAGVPALCLVLASNPVGWAVVLGGIAGGVVGGVLGGIGGAKLDEVLWDESEDTVQHVYEFFSLETKRGETPKVYEEAVVTRHFKAKMEEHPDDSE
ncbi:hypothetical protein PHYSODRAFT_305184 [Phytophthora sojae]|uniref:Uncharacterized protein n=1 Tax=Phytophthora sojae (strain P6497) TaxID=1094619 RepID=G5A544_PHYSP|nr:hypothetical protein PHYSODRAFT_305184 [Phytophthora sojae]EGZ09793.1 hypothetical protein PHYSODRAFT_305184 [Phytophthora sojae]|eukprot:XP_009534654.1 hypothetical protein PHYSODRAFT_305184 [Phytophthora sojae]